MSKDLTSFAHSEAETPFHTLILLWTHDFDEPLYRHAGIGELSNNGNTFVA